MAFPPFEYCIICDSVRPELGGKSILLGFYGVAPHVEITIGDMNRPVFLSFMAGTTPISEANINYEFVAAITRPDGIGIFQTPSMRLVTAGGKNVLLPIGFNIAPPILPGRYSIRIMVNTELKLDTSFSLRSGTAPELQRQPPTGTTALN